jgi:hypothetical protein
MFTAALLVKAGNNPMSTDRRAINKRGIVESGISGQ